MRFFFRSIWFILVAMVRLAFWLPWIVLIAIFRLFKPKSQTTPNNYGSKSNAKRQHQAQTKKPSPDWIDRVIFYDLVDDD